MLDLTAAETAGTFIGAGVGAGDLKTRQVTGAVLDLGKTF